MTYVLFTFRVILSTFLIMLGIFRLHSDGLVWQVFMSFGLGIANSLDPVEKIYAEIKAGIERHRERARRRQAYEQFKADVKSSLFTDEQAGNEARRVIK